MLAVISPSIFAIVFQVRIDDAAIELDQVAGQLHVALAVAVDIDHARQRKVKFLAAMPNLAVDVVARENRVRRIVAS